MSLTPWNEQRAKRDKNGHFAAVDTRVHQGAAQLNQKTQQRAPNSIASGITQSAETHPYLAMALTAAGTTAGGRKALDFWAKGKIVRAAKKISDIPRTGGDVAHGFKYGDIISQQGADMKNFMPSTPEDIIGIVGDAYKNKLTGRFTLPRAEFGENSFTPKNANGRVQGGVEGRGTSARYGVNHPPRDEFKNFTSSEVYSPKALQTFRGGTPEETLRNVEKFISKRSHESSFIMADGKLVSGMSGHQTLTPWMLPHDQKLRGTKFVFTHNHPSFGKNQPRSFSPGDVNILAQLVKQGASKDSTLRAVYSDGTVQEMVITDWRKFNQYNRINQATIMESIKGSGTKLSDLDAEKLLSIQSQVQAAADGRNGFMIVEHQGFAKARNLSQAQIDRKKRVGAELTRATSVVGLGSLAALGGAAAAPKLARAGKLGKVTVENAEKFKAGVKDKAFTAGVVSSGVGGFNGLNNASWQSAEARQRKQSLAKSFGDMDSLYGEIGKAWEPNASKYDPEVARHKRNRQEVAGGAAVTAGLAGNAVRHAGLSEAGAREAEDVYRAKGPYSKYKGLKQAEAFHGKKAGKFGLAATGAGAATAALEANRRKNKSWETYSKSAFGINHE